MTIGPSLLQIILLACALSCFVLTLRERRHRPLAPMSLGAPALLSGICALLFLVLEAGTGQPPWTSLAALAAGVAIGTLRGITLKLQVDHMFATILIPRSLGSFMVALALIAAVLIDIASSLTGVAAASLRSLAADAAALCAGALIGRWIVVMVRWSREPHVDLRQ